MPTGSAILDTRLRALGATDKQLAEMDYQSAIAMLREHEGSACRALALEIHNRQQGRFKADRRRAYDLYMKSREWETKRSAAIARTDGLCERCGSTECIQVHHKTYKRLGYEWPEDLEVLCRACHARHHHKKITRAKRLRR